MSTNNDGGPAFPRTGFVSEMEHGVAEYENKPEKGMTLRDWFAGQALAGLSVQRPEDDDPMIWNHRMLANGAYALADAMLAAREAKQ